MNDLDKEIQKEIDKWQAFRMGRYVAMARNGKQPVMITKMEILDYEIRGSWWISFVSWEWLQDLVSGYVSWKVDRKYARYLRSVEAAAILREMSPTKKPKSQQP